MTDSNLAQKPRFLRELITEPNILQKPLLNRKPDILKSSESNVVQPVFENLRIECIQNRSEIFFRAIEENEEKLVKIIEESKGEISEILVGYHRAVLVTNSRMAIIALGLIYKNYYKDKKSVDSFFRLAGTALKEIPDEQLALFMLLSDRDFLKELFSPDVSLEALDNTTFSHGKIFAGKKRSAYPVFSVEEDVLEVIVAELGISVENFFMDIDQLIRRQMLLPGHGTIDLAGNASFGIGHITEQFRAVLLGAKKKIIAGYNNDGN